MNNIRLNEQLHSFFLGQQRLEVVLRELIRPGHEVVLCAQCETAHFPDSWINPPYPQACVNCGNTSSLEHIPSQAPNIALTTPIITNFNSNIEGEYFSTSTEITLSWTVEHADVVMLNEEIVLESGRKNCQPTDDTVYLLRASNNRGSVSEQIILKILPPQIIEFQSSSDFISEDTPIELSWKVSSATSIIITSNRGSEIDVTEISDQKISVHPTSDTTYTLLATNTRTSRSREINLRLLPITISLFNVSKSVVLPKETVRLTWQTQHTTRIEIAEFGDVTHLSFLDIITPDQDTEIIMTAYGVFNHQVQRRIFIKVARIESLRSIVSNKDEFFLKWSSKYLARIFVINNYEEEIFQNDHPEILRNGEFSIPSATKNEVYKIRALTLEGDYLEKSVELKAASITYFKSTPGILPIGTPLIIEWKVTNARKIFIDHGIGEVTNLNRLEVIASSLHRNLTMTVLGDNNIASRILTVKIIVPPEIKTLNIPTPAMNFSGLTNSLAKQMKPSLLPAIKLPDLSFISRNQLKINLTMATKNNNLKNFITYFQKLSITETEDYYICKKNTIDTNTNLEETLRDTLNEHLNA